MVYRNRGGLRVHSPIEDEFCTFSGFNFVVYEYVHVYILTAPANSVPGTKKGTEKQWSRREARNSRPGRFMAAVMVYRNRGGARARIRFEDEFCSFSGFNFVLYEYVHVCILPTPANSVPETKKGTEKEWSRREARNST